MRLRRKGGEVPCPVGFATKRSGRVPQCRPPMGLVSGDQGARSKSMPEASKRRWVRCIVVRSRDLMNDAG
jgi:hypothetical protein